MGWVIKTSSSTYRANWRDPSGRQKAKSFTTKRQATDFLADVEAGMNHGSYVNPAAGKVKFGAYALRWMASRNYELTTTARDISIMRKNVIPRWGTTQLARIDHLEVQNWITQLGQRLAPATVAECHRLMAGVMKAAVRDRLIARNPCEGIRLPRKREKAGDCQTITRQEFTHDLLPVVPHRYRALVGLSAGTGMRWGECVGLRREAVDLAVGIVRVERVAVEVGGHVSDKPYPKSKAGRRTLPVPPITAQLLSEHFTRYGLGPAGQLFTNTVGGPLQRGHFRARVWRPSLVRAALLGKISQDGETCWRAIWVGSDGLESAAEFGTERGAVRHVARHAQGGLHFHDLRHSFATWLVTEGVPINDVQQVMGHEQASTTLDRYTHSAPGRDERVLGALADFLLTPEPEQDTPEDESDDNQGDDLR